MQYILTQEELDSLNKRASEGAALAKLYPNKKELQKFCSMVADHMPVQSGWYKGKVWGCILTTKKYREEDEYPTEWYCDECPAQNLCPYNYKSWSK